MEIISLEICMSFPKRIPFRKVACRIYFSTWSPSWRRFRNLKKKQAVVNNHRLHYHHSKYFSGCNWFKSPGQFFITSLLWPNLEDVYMTFCKMTSIAQAIARRGTATERSGIRLHTLNFLIKLSEKMAKLFTVFRRRNSQPSALPKTKARTVTVQLNG